MICKGKVENIRLEFLKIDKTAKPFQNKLNYNFHRSATEKEVNDRISFMLSCNDPISKMPFKRNMQETQKEYDLVKQRGIFLKSYFNLS